MSTPAFTLPASFVEQYGEDLYHCASCNYCIDAVWTERGIAHVCATLEHHSPAPGYSGRGFIIPIDRTGTVSRHGPSSSTVTLKPASASRAAATAPPKPLPMTKI